MPGREERRPGCWPRSEKHEAGRNLDLIRQEFGNYQNGIMPAGPGARELTAFFAHVDGDLAAYAATAPSVAATDQHLLNLLSKRAGVLHLGAANYCWFTNPSQALCLRLAGTPDAGAPLIGMCDSARCPQATHHPAIATCGPKRSPAARCSWACSAGPAKPSTPG